MDISSLRERGERIAFSVSELNTYIKRLFDSDRTLSAISVKGEISNFTNHRSGHLYFSLKDSDGQIRAVMFKSSAVRLKFVPENGMKVVCRGSVTVYQRDGSYQLYVNSIEPDGIGALYLAYEQLKEKLYSEGLFDEMHKKILPNFPERIGVITSPTGAAVRDIINVTGRRYPLAKIYLYPSLVQGDGAVPNLIKAIDYFESSKLVDVIIIGRGGGSIEDLWAFNSEDLARRIYSADIPIISAVGHETDFTICDFVSDMRAPTPSAAAELAVPDVREITLYMDGAFDRLNSALLRFVERKRDRLNTVSESRMFKEPSLLFADYSRTLADFSERAERGIGQIVRDKRAQYVLNSEKLNALSPLSILKRGYSLVESDGSIVNTVDVISVGQTVDIRLSDGCVNARVEQIACGRKVENE